MMSGEPIWPPVYRPEPANPSIRREPSRAGIVGDSVPEARRRLCAIIRGAT
jgi:hypothetical protein